MIFNFMLFYFQLFVNFKYNVEVYFILHYLMKEFSDSVFFKWFLFVIFSSDFVLFFLYLGSLFFEELLFLLCVTVYMFLRNIIRYWNATKSILKYFIIFNFMLFCFQLFLHLKNNVRVYFILFYFMKEFLWFCLF